MSITYSGLVANTNSFTFLKILALWRGSIYKNILAELFILIIIHTLFGCCFYFLFTPENYPQLNQLIVTICTSISENIEYVPVAFVLGFYLSLVLSRWYDEIGLVPWIDETAFLVNTYINSSELNATYLRRSIVRYLNAAFVLAAREYLYDIFQQFPDKNHIIKSGILTEQEWVKLTRVYCKFSHYYVATNWAINLAYYAREKEWIRTDRELDKLVTSIGQFRSKIATFFIVDYINPPLAYTQIVGLALYCYICGSVVSSINLKLNDSKNRSAIQLIFGILPPMQFLHYAFFIGWYKCAVCLINPFGRTDNNFDAIYAVQRNLQAGFLIVDKFKNMIPPLDVEFEISNEFASSYSQLDHSEMSVTEKMEYVLSDDDRD